MKEKILTGKLYGTLREDDWDEAMRTIRMNRNIITRIRMRGKMRKMTRNRMARVRMVTVKRVRRI